MSGCTRDTVPVPPGTRIVHVTPGVLAILECGTGYMWPTNADGIMWCGNNAWKHNIPDCIPRPTPSPPVETTPESTTTESLISQSTAPDLQTTTEPFMTTQVSGCTEELVPIPDGTRLIYIKEGTVAVLECKSGHQFPTTSDGAYFCQNNKWTGDIPACIPRPPITSTTTTTTQATTTEEVCQNCVTPKTTQKPEIMGDMGKALLGVGVGLVVVLLLVGVSCFIFSVVSKRRKRKIEEQQNMRNKQTENENSLDKSIGDTDFEGTQAVWVSSGNIYGGGTYVPIPDKSEHTYLSVDTVDSSKKSAKINTKNSTNKELDKESIPDTRRLILRYSGTSVESSGSSEDGSSFSTTITPPSTAASSSIMPRSDKPSTTEYEASRTSFPAIPPSTAPSSSIMPRSDKPSTAGYEAPRTSFPAIPPSTAPSSSIMPRSDKPSTAGYEPPRTSFPGSDVSLTSLYGKDAGIYDSILTDLEPRYIAHAVTDAPDQSLGHCI